MTINNKIEYRNQGKKNRQSGAAFERKVRADLEGKGWIVDKWSNNVEFIDKPDHKIDKDGYDVDLIKVEGKLIPAKRKYNPFSKVMAIGTGFPDFTAYHNCGNLSYTIIGVECKSNGYLSKVEKEKCKWLLDNNIFSKIYIASKDNSKKGAIIYKEYEPKK